MFDMNNSMVVTVFTGRGVGIAISKRGPDDSHLCLTHLVEDDGCWHVSSGTTSTYFLPEWLQCLNSAMDWLEDNAVRGSWGWDLPEDYVILSLPE